MNERERWQLRMDAKMDGARAIAHSLGKKVKLSEMELVVLTTFAKVGMFGHMADTLEPEMARNCRLMRQAILEECRETFGRPGCDGLDALATSCAALVCDGRLAKYVCEPREED